MSKWRNCAVKGCLRRAKTRYCQAHQDRLRRSGNLQEELPVDSLAGTRVRSFLARMRLPRGGLLDP